MTWKPAGTRASVQAAQVRGDHVDVEVPVAAAVGRVGVRRGSATRCASPARRRRTGRRPARAHRWPRCSAAASRGGGDRLAPVADRPRRRARCATQFPPVVEAADVGAGALVHGHHTGGGERVERGGACLGALLCGQQCPRGGPHPMMGVGGQRARRRGSRRRRSGRVPARAARSTPAPNARRRAPGRRDDGRGRRRARRW